MLRPLLTVLVLSASAAAVVRATSPQFPEPTPHHERILKGVGHWEGTITNFMPGLPSDPMPATETVTAVGPFWTQVEFHSEFMGMPYTGSGCVGYDTTKQKYVGTWFDSGSTYLSVMEGEYNEDQKALVMHWDAPDMEGVMQKFRTVTKRSDNAYSMTFFMGDGEGMKTMEINMKRAEAKKALEAGTGR